jgi:hypothetical protein
MRQVIIIVFFLICSCNISNVIDYDSTLKCNTKGIDNFNFKEKDSIVLKHNLFSLLKDIDSINNKVLRTQYPKIFLAEFNILPLSYFKYFEDNYREVEVDYYLISKTNPKDVYLIDTSLRNIIYGVRIDLYRNRVTDIYIVGYKKQFVQEKERLKEAYDRILKHY